MRLLATFLCALVCLPAPAWEFLRPQDAIELPDAPEDTFVALAHPRLGDLDVQLLRHDYPLISRLSDNELRDWFTKETGFIAARQLGLNGVRQTPIAVNWRRMKTGYRPHGWKRSALLPLLYNHQLVGYADLKGVGLSEDVFVEDQLHEVREARVRGAAAEHHLLFALRDRPYSDGLASLGETAAEAWRQEATQFLFDERPNQSQDDWQTVETYGFLDAGFDVLRSSGKDPAGIYVRQAHFGRLPGTQLPPGLISAPAAFLQHTWSGALVDFGAVRIDAQTHPPLHGSFEWPNQRADYFETYHSRSWVRGHEAARAFRHGDVDAFKRARHELLGEAANRRYRFLHPLSASQKRRRLAITQAHRLGLQPGASDRDALAAVLTTLPSFDFPTEGKYVDKPRSIHSTLFEGLYAPLFYKLGIHIDGDIDLADQFPERFVVGRLRDALEKWDTLPEPRLLVRLVRHPSSLVGDLALRCLAKTDDIVFFPDFASAPRRVAELLGRAVLSFPTTGNLADTAAKLAEGFPAGSDSLVEPSTAAALEDLLRNLPRRMHSGVDRLLHGCAALLATE